MGSSRVTRLHVSVLLSVVLTAGLTSTAFGASAAGPTPMDRSTAAEAGVAVPATACPCTLSGTVYASDGTTPLQGVHVAAGHVPNSYFATTGSDGSYTVTGLPQNEYTLGFTDPEARYLNGYYDSDAFGGSNFTFSIGAATVVDVESNMTGVNVSLWSGVHITGSVVDTGGAAIAGIQVLAYIPSGYQGVATTAADGTYAVLIPPNLSYTMAFTDNSGHFVMGYYASNGVGHLTAIYGSATPVVVGMSDLSVLEVTMAKPWSIGLGTSQLSVTVGTSVTLTATTNQMLDHTPYYCVIEASDNSVLTFYGGGTTCSTTVSSGVPAVHEYHAVVGFSNGSSPVATSNTVSVTWTVPATHLSVSTLNPYPAGSKHSVTVKALDADGKVAPGYRGTIHFTSTDTRAILPADYTFSPGDAGVHVFTGGLTLTTAGSRSVPATDTVSASITGAETVTVTPGAARTLTVSTSAAWAAGARHTVTVTAKDAYGNTATGYLGTIHFTSSDAAAVLPADYTFLASDKGVHAFSGGLTLKTAGSRSVTATDTVTSSITGGQSGIVVSPGVAKTFLVSAANPWVAGVNHTITVTAKDAYGNTATGYTGTIHCTSSDPAATLPADYTFIVSDAGVHRLTGRLMTAGSQWVRVTDTHTATITGSATITVS